MRKLTEQQQRVLDKMRRKPDEIHFADALDCELSTLQSLQRRGLVSGVFGYTSTFGARRGMFWKLTAQGKATP